MDRATLSVDIECISSMDGSASSELDISEAKESMNGFTTSMVKEKQQETTFSDINNLEEPNEPAKKNHVNLIMSFDETIAHEDVTDIEEQIEDESDTLRHTTYYEIDHDHE